ncbi:phage scaffolding protein [Lysinibacillus xylanilyticus]|uniref:phage scaffolding protein n=1 Tax=Lysinibacillus xylanilyticus TaxID=582475 RepID=UPI003D0635A8
MKKEDLIALGLSEEQANKIIEGFGTMIPKSRFDEVNGENKSLKEQLDDRDKQLKELAKNEEATEGLKSEITRLQDENKATTEKHSAEVKQLKINSAVELALTSAKSRNLTATKALLDLDGVEIDKDGSVIGLEDKVKALVENEETKFMFASDETVITGTIPGGQPSGGGDPVDTSKMTYSQLVAYQEANPEAKI